MKRLASLLIVLLCVVGPATAQNFKFGHINSQELLNLMPERDSALVKLQKFGAELDETIQEMQQELQTKYNTYQQKQATWTAAVLEAKSREITEINTRLEQFNQTAQQDYQEMYQTLFQPVQAKAIAAINKVAKDQGFTYVFDLSVQSIAYYDTNVSVDLLPLVKAELGIPAEKVAPTQIEEPAE